ncbi:MAG: hypothetical protein AAGA31_05930 [Bacteroidota bacterium]
MSRYRKVGYSSLVVRSNLLGVFVLFWVFNLGGQADICGLRTADAARLFQTSMLTQNPALPCRPKLFLLAGFLGEAEALYAVPEDLRKSIREKNAYDLALIRAGDQPRIERLKRLLEAATVDDDFIFEVAPKLIYTRRREVMDFLFAEILKDQNNCSPADSHTSGRINCAYRIMEMVAPVIQEFPLAVGASGDLTVTDYPKALAIARAWIEDNQTSYRIITDTY